MSPQSSKYQAYSLATRTVAKTRQVVMLYDGTIRFIQQAKTAITEKRIEDRFHLLTKASKVICGLQNSIDFENGGDIAMVLHRFYMDMSVRILSVNFKREGGEEMCDTLIEELKQMRDVWHNIDLTLGAGSDDATQLATPAIAAAATATTLPGGNVSDGGNVTISA
jgi:flagellar protein FliS